MVKKVTIKIYLAFTYIHLNVFLRTMQTGQISSTDEATVLQWLTLRSLIQGMTSENYKEQTSHRLSSQAPQKLITSEEVWFHLCNSSIPIWNQLFFLNTRQDLNRYYEDKGHCQKNNLISKDEVIIFCGKSCKIKLEKHGHRLLLCPMGPYLKEKNNCTVVNGWRH